MAKLRLIITIDYFSIVNFNAAFGDQAFPHNPHRRLSSNQTFTTYILFNTLFCAGIKSLDDISVWEYAKLDEKV